MKKSDIDTHSAHHYGAELPAINVKMYRGPGTVPPSVSDIAEHFGCDDATAERALAYHTECSQDDFWRDIAPDAASEILGPRATVYSAGRCGGWLIVEGLPPVESWDAIAVSRWTRFAKRIHGEMADLLSRDATFANIAANEWARPHAERYNFIDRDGKTECVADLKERAIAAGYGPVVRS